MTHSLEEPRSTANPGRPANPRSARILDAASRCFSKKGFQNTTIIDVADAAGVSRPLVYKYFGDKDGLIDSVLRTAFEDWTSLIGGPSSRSGSASEALADKFRRATGFVRQRPIFRSILQQDAEIVLRGHLDGLIGCRAASAESTRRILRAGVESGEFAQDLDPESTTMSIEMILFGLLERALGIRPGLSLDPDLERATIRLVLSGLSAGGNGQ